MVSTTPSLIDNILTPWLSHKAIRRQQNQLAYRRRKALSESEAKSWLLPRNLPKKLSKAAHFSLPTSPIFRYAAESGDAVQDTDYDDKWLSEFNGPPPYSPQAMLLAQENLISLVDALHGWHLRQQCDFERSRLHRYKTQPVDVMMGEVHSDMLSYLKDWEALEHSTKAVQELGGEIHHEVAFLRSQWAARRCYCLGKDFNALQNGSDAFLCVYVDRWS
jgi:hypothetical protein